MRKTRFHFQLFELNKMLQFPIQWPRPAEPTRDERNRRIFRLELDNEWAVVIVLGKENFVNNVEIHRRNTDGEYSISGMLGFTLFMGAFPVEKFSHFIKAGSSFVEIASKFKGKYFHDAHYLVGHVNISDRIEKHVTSSANVESKERIQLQSLQELSKDLQRALDPESSYFADVTLKCDGVSIPAHKFILSARSPVFAAMFANPMKERLKNEVDITDIDEPVLRDLLMYMYTGKTSDLTVSSSADLLFAADKYQIQDLKTVCSYFLKTSVSLHTVWKILVVGDLLSEDLKSFAMDYVCSNSGEFSVIKNSQEFKALRKERPELAMDLLESLVQYREKN